MITLTDSASAKVAQLLQEEDDDSLALRVGVRPGGCAGFNYEMFFDVKSADDTERSFGDVKVIADEVSAGLLKGASLDYLDGLGESGFKITNTNAQKTCGCGQSFC
jgi:iron-sulfur cluster assembly protein/iron-sulfur cluster insertion protein|tara:strand:- start:652 stop:969 length:318 start_codon:yes stop_codon:yes gene_type:complete